MKKTKENDGQRYLTKISKVNAGFSGVEARFQPLLLVFKGQRPTDSSLKICYNVSSESAMYTNPEHLRSPLSSLLDHGTFA